MDFVFSMFTFKLFSEEYFSSSLIFPRLGCDLLLCKYDTPGLRLLGIYAQRRTFNKQSKHLLRSADYAKYNWRHIFWLGVAGCG